MRVRMTEIYRDWINSLKDESDERASRFESITWSMETLGNIET